MKNKSVKHNMDGLIALLVFGVFAVCVLAVLITGAGAYQRLTQRDQTAYDQRTVLQYVATRVRQHDSREAIGVTQFGGGSCLTLRQEGEETSYLTRVYWYDGAVWELYTEEGLELSPEAGERIMDAERLSFALQDGLLTVSASVHGTEESLTLALRSDAGEVRP